jgi:carbon monoxide dehydrogenase subunit G
MRPTHFIASLVLLALPAVAHADAESARADDPSKDPQVVRLLEAKKTLKWNFSPAGTQNRYGHAEALVAAPAAKVAKTATEFGHYRELHRKFATARVVGKEGENTDVYMRYPVYIGPMKVEFYEVMRFGGVHANGATHVLEGRGIKGDMKQGHTIITVRPVDATHSLLSVDVLLVPKIPAPQSLIDEELRDGAQDFVNGLKDRAQGWVGPVTSL